MKELERSLKALANRRRLTILKYLKTHPESPVSDIASAIRLSFKATSKHLNILAGVNILEKDQRSLKVFYRLASTQKPGIRHILTLL